MYVFHRAYPYIIELNLRQINRDKLCCTFNMSNLVLCFTPTGVKKPLYEGVENGLPWVSWAFPPVYYTGT